MSPRTRAVARRTTARATACITCGSLNKWHAPHCEQRTRESDSDAATTAAIATIGQQLDRWTELCRTGTP
jgi:hypothetical protein